MDAVTRALFIAFGAEKDLLLMQRFGDDFPFRAYKARLPGLAFHPAAHQRLALGNDLAAGDESASVFHRRLPDHAAAARREIRRAVLGIDRRLFPAFEYRDRRTRAAHIQRHPGQRFLPQQHAAAHGIHIGCRPEAAFRDPALAERTQDLALGKAFVSDDLNIPDKQTGDRQQQRKHGSQDQKPLFSEPPSPLPASADRREDRRLAHAQCRDPLHPIPILRRQAYVQGLRRGVLDVPQHKSRLCAGVEKPFRLSAADLGSDSALPYRPVSFHASHSKERISPSSASLLFPRTRILSLLP